MPTHNTVLVGNKDLVLQVSLLNISARLSSSLNKKAATMELKAEDAFQFSSMVLNHLHTEQNAIKCTIVRVQHECREHERQLLYI